MAQLNKGQAPRNSRSSGTKRSRSFRRGAALEERWPRTAGVAHISILRIFTLSPPMLPSPFFSPWPSSSSVSRHPFLSRAFSYAFLGVCPSARSVWALLEWNYICSPPLACSALQPSAELSVAVLLVGLFASCFHDFASFACHVSLCAVPMFYMVEKRVTMMMVLVPMEP